MADTMTPEERSRCMAAIKGKDTKPEMIVRKYLFSRGLRYRVQDRRLPGRPDIVLPKYKTVVFVDGCFWHGHEGCRYFRMPRSNVEFWQTKISRNKSRDVRNEAKLTEMGWRVLRVWECEIRKVAGRQEYLEGLYERIVGASGQEHNSTDGQEYREYEEKDIDIAAEDEETYGDADDQKLTFRKDVIFHHEEKSVAEANTSYGHTKVEPRISKYNFNYEYNPIARTLFKEPEETYESTDKNQD